MPTRKQIEDLECQRSHLDALLEMYNSEFKKSGNGFDTIIIENGHLEPDEFLKKLDGQLTRLLTDKKFKELSGSDARERISQMKQERNAIRSLYFQDMIYEDMLAKMNASVAISASDRIPAKGKISTGILYYLLSAEDAFEVETALNELYDSVFLRVANGEVKKANRIFNVQLFYSVIRVWFSKLLKPTIAFLAFFGIANLWDLLKKIGKS